MNDDPSPSPVRTVAVNGTTARNTEEENETSLPERDSDHPLLPTTAEEEKE